MKTHRAYILILALSVIVISCEKNEEFTQVGVYEQQLHDEVNKYRASQGLNELVLQFVMVKEAQLHAIGRANGSITQENAVADINERWHTIESKLGVNNVSNEWAIQTQITTQSAAEVVAEWEARGVVMQRVLIDVQEGLSAALLINHPPGATAEEPIPAILCCHGHGPHGKEPGRGNRSTAEIRASVLDANYDYGLRMAQAGFVTCAIDWMGFGERSEDHKPNPGKQAGDRDWCNVYY